MKQHRASSLIFSIIVWAGVAAMLPQGLAARQRAAAKTEEIVGIVTQVSVSSLTVRTASADRDVRLTSSTVVRIDGHASPISAIAVGDKVEVHAQKESDGTSTALTIEVESHPATEVEGIVKSVSATSLTVTTATGDVVIALTSTTRYFMHGQSAIAADVHVGDRVEVEAREQTDTSLAALVVKIQNESVHLRGTIAAVSASSITVHTASGDVVVALTSSTLIRMQGKVTNASMLLVGSHVEVEAVHQADQSLAAVTITTELANSLSEIEGTVTEVGSDHLKIHTKSGDDVTVAVNADTIIRSSDHLAGLTDINVGDRVNVNARVNADGILTALRIEVQVDHGDGDGSEDHGAELTGNITSISSSAIDVTTGGGITVTVQISSTTSIRHGNTTLTPADLKVGNHVEVKGALNADGSIAATEIKVEDITPNNDDHPEHVEINGIVTAVSSS